MLIIDTHCHAGNNWFEPVETLLHEMNLNDVAQAVLIQHGGTYDPTYLFECAERFKGRFKVVVLLDPEDSDQPGTLEKLAEEGASGVRLYPDDRVNGPDPLAVWKKAGELGLVVSSLGDVTRFASPEFADLVDECVNTTIVIEHLAGARKSFVPPYDEYQRALKLAESPQTYIKVPGLGEFTGRPPRLAPEFNFDSVPPLIEMARDIFGVQRMMWGSDFPPVAGREGYRNALNGVLQHPAWDTHEDIEWVMGKTAANVWGFDG
jgi:L-fuconolactonase